MPRIQNYISNELTHFVGRGKTEEEQYDLLVNKILKSGWLMHPPHDLKQKSGWEVNFNSLPSKNELVNPRMICFCDIPVGDLSIHMTKYSRFGLSFRKAFLIGKGANPVHYIAKNSPVELLSPAINRAEFYDTRTGNYLQFLHVLAENQVPKNPDGTFKTPLTFQTAPTYMGLQSISYFLIQEVFGYIKFFDDSKKEDDPENYYMEREWRLVNHLNFQIDDVCRVIFPENYTRRFRSDVSEFNGQITFSE